MKLLIEASALIPIYRNILAERSLGGTETAVIRIAEELVKLGVDVDIRSAFSTGSEGAPRYLGQNEQVNFAKYDVCLVVQNWRVIHQLPFMKTFLWTGDGSEQFSNMGIGDLRLQRRFSGLIVTTNFHKSSLCDASGFPLAKTYVVGNGVSEDFFSRADKKRSGLIYHSAPYRGLEHLLRYFKSLQSENLNTTLKIYSDMDLYRRGSSYVGLYSDVIQRLVANYQDVKGVSFNKTIPQSVLAQELKSAKIFPYPCTVPEVFCMSMLEAMAAGVVPLVSDIGGLGEVIGCEDLVVSGSPGNKTFDQEFLNRLRQLITDNDYAFEKANFLIKRAMDHFKWEAKARALKSLLEEHCK